MYSTFEPDYEPATADYVLAVIREDHRQQCCDFAADPEVNLSFDTTIDDWFYECDLDHWKDLRHGLNHKWQINISDKDWRAALEPSKQKTLADVCQLIAGHAKRPRVRPARILGRDCLSAGVFLTIRTLLKKAGASADRIGPSTPLEPFLRPHMEVFLGPISMLAPGSLPELEFESRRIDRFTESALLSPLLGFILLIMGEAFNSVPLVIVGLIGLMIGLFAFVVSRFIPPRRVELGNLKTFRDLSLVIAEAVKHPTNP